MGILDRLKKQKLTERPAAAPSPTGVAARLAASRDEIVATMTAEYGKAIAGIRGMGLAERSKSGGQS
jgi:hypothetical protein